MNRYNTALNKKPKKKKTSLFNRVINGNVVKEKKETKPPPRPSTQRVRSIDPPGERAGIGTFNPSPSAPISESVGIGTFNPFPTAPIVAHQGDVYSIQGPTSQHVVIAGPDGHRVVIPLRILRYSITHNREGTTEIRLTIPAIEGRALGADIQRGMERWQRNNGQI